MWEFGRWSLGHVENPCARLRLKRFDATISYNIWIECYCPILVTCPWARLEYVTVMMDDILIFT